MSDEITMSAKFAGKCSECGFKFSEGTRIKFHTFKRTAKHAKCPEVSYDGSEQASIFGMWIERAQEIEHPLAKADRRHEQEMWGNTSPHLSQPDEDLEG